MKRSENMLSQQIRVSIPDQTKPVKKQRPGVFQGWKRYEEAEEEE